MGHSVNQENRLKLMLSTAKRVLREESEKCPDEMKEESSSLLSHDNVI
jgi:predicted nucleotide-binding protein (sugar kinase/HSP70/actin superfamily)